MREIVYKKLSEIKPYENNPRINDEAVEPVANSIKEFGFNVPITIDKNGVIVTGHTRYKASQTLGLEEVPCVILDDLDEEQIKAYRLADNKVGELAEWDFELLEELRNEMQPFKIDLTMFGFDDYINEVENMLDLQLGEEVKIICPRCGTEWEE